MCPFYSSVITKRRVTETWTVTETSLQSRPQTEQTYIHLAAKNKAQLNLRVKDTNPAQSNFKTIPQKHENKWLVVQAMNSGMSVLQPCDKC